MDLRRAIDLVNVLVKKPGGAALTEDASPAPSAFDQWFAGSQIVDAAGQPLKLFHGTSKDQDFRSFKMPKNGIWFTTDPESASEYAKDNDSKGVKYDDQTRQYRDVHTASRVIPVYVRATKVYNLDSWPDKIHYATNYRREQGMFFDMLRFQGYDAINYKNAVYVVIGSPNQIKSAIGNRGTFDPSKKNIDEDATAATTVRLYHGTTSVIVPEIERYGLQATGGEGTYEHLCALAKEVMSELPDGLKRELRRIASYYRTPSIYLTPNLKVATDHARDNGNAGGEIGGEVLEAIRKFRGVDEAELATLFPRGAPVVLTVDIPLDWLRHAPSPGQYEVVLHRREIGPEFITGIERV